MYPPSFIQDLAHEHVHDLRMLGLSTPRRAGRITRRVRSARAAAWALVPTHHRPAHRPLPLTIPVGPQQCA